jgi:pimeloyl-ACP methyl ester carboxylesterase
MDATTKRVRQLDATGTGTTVVVLQGEGAAARIVPILAQQFRVLRYAIGDFGAAAAGATIAELTDAIGQHTSEPVGLIADAATADAALAFVVARPELVRALALVAAPIPRKALAEIKTPVIALFGTHRRESQVGRRTREAIPGCNVMFVYDANHDMSNQRPEAVAAALREFMIAGDRFLVTSKSGKLYP